MLSFYTIFKVRFYSSYVKSLRLVSALNPDCSIRMNCDNGPRVAMPLGFCFAENTIFPYQYLIANFVIIVYLFSFSRKLLRSV
jgi:hypothetical protein